jgi:outer membrane biosynthesis protein TonB
LSASLASRTYGSRWLARFVGFLAVLLSTVFVAISLAPAAVAGTVAASPQSEEGAPATEGLQQELGIATPKPPKIVMPEPPKIPEVATPKPPKIVMPEPPKIPEVATPKPPKIVVPTPPAVPPAPSENGPDPAPSDEPDPAPSDEPAVGSNGPRADESAEDARAGGQRSDEARAASGGVAPPQPSATFEGESGLARASGPLAPPSAREPRRRPRATGGGAAPMNGSLAFLDEVRGIALEASGTQALTAEAGRVSPASLAWILLAAVAFSALVFAGWLRRTARARVGADGVGVLAPAELKRTGGPPRAFPAASDADLLASFLALHRVVMEADDSGSRRWLGAEAAAIAVALERFAPASTNGAAAGFRKLAGPGGEGEALMRRLEEASDGDLVFAVLTLHKLAQEDVAGQAGEALADEARALAAILERFAPDALERGLAAYFGERTPDHRIPRLG